MVLRHETLYIFMILLNSTAQKGISPNSKTCLGIRLRSKLKANYYWIKEFGEGQNFFLKKKHKKKIKTKKKNLRNLLTTFYTKIPDCIFLPFSFEFEKQTFFFIHTNGQCLAATS